MTRLLDELRSILTTEQQKEKIEQIENCQLSLIALSEKDAFIEGFKIGVRMTTETYADTQQRGYTMIYDYVNQYYAENSRYPSVRDIVAGTGIPVSTVHRYLNDMKESGEIEYNGRRSISTAQTEMESPSKYMKVLGYVACGEGQEEEETVIEYIRMPESIVGKGNFFALIAKGESMIDAGIHPGDYVIVRQQKGANDGGYVVALYEGKNNLKQLIKEDGRYILRSCNEDKETYPDIYPEDLQIQGVAVCVTHKLI